MNNQEIIKTLRQHTFATVHDKIRLVRPLIIETTFFRDPDFVCQLYVAETQDWPRTFVYSSEYFHGDGISEELDQYFCDYLRESIGHQELSPYVQEVLFDPINIDMKTKEQLEYLKLTMRY